MVEAIFIKCDLPYEMCYAVSFEDLFFSGKTRDFLAETG